MEKLSRERVSDLLNTEQLVKGKAENLCMELDSCNPASANSKHWKCGSKEERF